MKVSVYLGNGVGLVCIIMVGRVVFFANSLNQLATIHATMWGFLPSTPSAKEGTSLTQYGRHSLGITFLSSLDDVEEELCSL